MPHPSFSAAPTPSEGCVPPSPAPAVADANTNKSFSEKIKKSIRKRSIVTCFDGIPNLAPLTKEQIKEIQDLDNFNDDPEELPDRLVFDAKHLLRDPPKYCGGLAVIRNFKKDPSLFHRLTKSAPLAIADYSSKTKTNCRFVNIEMAIRQLVSRVLYHITFRAKNAEKKYKTFEAMFTNRGMRKVQRIRMKECDAWDKADLECSGNVS